MADSEKTWVPLSARERRVAGVLVEKAKTTPEYYPMTVAALVSGSNQKSNRDPITNYSADDVEEILEDLRAKGAAVRVEGTGRVIRWKHTLYDWLGAGKRLGSGELAVMAELLLRGPQTEGDVRARASRMESLADLPALQAVLDSLATRGLIVYLTPPGQRRGVVVTHGLYPPDELERVRQAHASSAIAEDDEPKPARSGPGLGAEVAALRAEVEALRGTVESLAAEVRNLKQSLGA